MCHCAGKEMVDFIADYLENIRSRRVFPDVSPGYMRTLVPISAPQDPEPWQRIFDDIETVVMPGVSGESHIPLRYLVADRLEAGHRPAASWNLAYHLAR